MLRRIADADVEVWHGDGFQPFRLNASRRPFPVPVASRKGPFGWYSRDRHGGVPISSAALSANCPMASSKAFAERYYLGTAAVVNSARPKNRGARPLPKFAAVLLAVLALSLPALADDKRVPASRAEVELSYAPLVKRTAPAVVNIYTRKTVRTRQVAPLFDDPFFRRFFGDQLGQLGPTREKTQNSLGSGVILRPDGLIVTNEHVIEGADEIVVVLADRREFQAKVVGADDRTDLAVLRIEAGKEPLPFLDIRDSDDLEVGDLVLAIGNPFGVGQTVTSGIVSAVARTQVGISDLGSFIQTDAAINPGNSGGALVTLDGRLVGINTAIFSKNGGYMGIGFATPSNMVRSVVASLTASGKVIRPWAGVAGDQVNGDTAAALGLSRPTGVLVSEVHPGGAGEKAGLRPGDVILEINGRAVENPRDLRFRVATLPVGGTAQLTVWRRGERIALAMPLTPPPEIPPREETELGGGGNPLVGAVIANVSPALADELGLEDAGTGVILLRIKRGSAADRLGFKPGDRLLEVNGGSVDSVKRARSLLAERAGAWRIAIRRGGRVMELVINR
jgi:serine protease Do